MRTSSRLLRLSWILPAALLLGLATEASAQDAHAGMKMPAASQSPPSAVHQSRWSDPASWPDGKVPGAGSDQRD